ncbi:MAG TPA: ferric reductase-like transmembrane domain-containing protein [Polyangiales bacterium]|nr:ferric reductase-like transmembrane domain-containing protein [Polyangiales bacterium]
MEARRSLAQLEPEVRKLDRRIASVLERCFERLSGRDSNIDVRELGSALDLESEYLTQRILCVLDKDNDGLIDREDFLGSVRTLLFGTAPERLLLAFRIHDLDGDDALDRGELEHMIALGLSEDSLDAPLTEVSRLADLLLTSVDSDRDGRISFREFEEAVSKHASVLEHISQSGLIWLAPDDRVREYMRRSQPATWLPRARTQLRTLVHQLENSAGALAILATWLLLNGVLFARAVETYAAAGASLGLSLARGAGACLKLNCALMLLPVLRLTLTWIRRARRLRALPVDDAIAFHRLLGWAVLGFALLHTVAHLWNADPAMERNPFRTVLEMHAGRSGAALLSCLLLMFGCAVSVVRRRNFELFHLTHLLYLAFFPLLLAHSLSVLSWVLVPCLVFALDRALRIARRTHATHAVAAAALPSAVTHLSLARPPDFQHQPTDYVFARVPEIAKYEWHPFTISSAPERQHLSLHVRNLGNWTGALHKLIASGRTGRAEPLRVELDGPYGAPCTHILQTRYAVLIGAGIGATPFASVLESIALRGPHTLEKLHFFWINRDQRSFEWFRTLLADIERRGDAGRLDIRIHMTRGRHDAAAAIINLARELAHEQGRRDLITGLKSRTRMGHPDYKAELRAIAREHAPHPVAVYFCGPPGLARKIKAICAELGLEFRQEHF